MFASDIGVAAMRAPSTLLAQPDLRLWLNLNDSGKLVVRTGKVELGQGILTALAQIAAEESCVRPAQIVMPAASTLGPDEGHTVGSLSVEHSGPVMRFLGACLRARLLALAAQRLGLATTSGLNVHDGVVMLGPRESPWSYWTLADDLLRDPVTADIDLCPMPWVACKVVGTDVPRIDLAAKLIGGAFIQDMTVPGMRHASILRQPSVGARLKSFDAAKLAERHPGVDCLRRAEFVACVADNEAQARSAMQWLQRTAQWQADGAPAAEIGSDIAAWLNRQPCTETVVEAASEAPAGAKLTLRGTWTRPFLAHTSIGLSTACAWLHDNVMEIWTHSQGIFALRQQIARVLDRPVSSVVLHHVAGAGCYGHNGADDVALDAAVVAAAWPGTPVRVQWSREEELCHAPFGAAMAVRLEASLDADNKISSWSAHVTSTSHGTRPGMHGEVNLLAAGALDAKWLPRQVADVPEALGGGASRNARPIYQVGRSSLTLRLAASPARSSAIRALGAHANVLAIESMMDELADAAEIDAAAFRRRHLADDRAIAVLDEALTMSGWSRRAGSATGGTLGLGLARYKGRGAYCAVVAEIELRASVSVSHVWCAVDAGRLVNPDGARNQIEGSILQSLSWALKEAVRFDGTTPRCRSWQDYPILRFDEVPSITTHFVAAHDNDSLGVGEAAQGPASAAVANAVSRAIGVRARDLPLDRDRLIQLIEQG